MTTAYRFIRKPNRLPLDEYSRVHVASLTICTFERRRVFTKTAHVTFCIESLQRSANKHQVLVLAYCFMPDHVHLLIQNTGYSSIIGFVRDFKQMTGYHLKRDLVRQIWQKGYWDHFARVDEDVFAAARYIFANPVRAGLVSKAADYLFSGSFVWDRTVLVEG